MENDVDGEKWTRHLKFYRKTTTTKYHQLRTFAAIFKLRGMMLGHINNSNGDVTAGSGMKFQKGKSVQTLSEAVLLVW